MKAAGMFLFYFLFRQFDHKSIILFTESWYSFECCLLIGFQFYLWVQSFKSAKFELYITINTVDSYLNFNVRHRVMTHMGCLVSTKDVGNRNQNKGKA